MAVATIRENLSDYIRIAADKTMNAIYMMLEDQIAEELEWWKNVNFSADLEKRYNAWKKGEDKGFSKNDIKESIAGLKKKRAN